MVQNEKIEFLKFAIDRYDHYYESVNNKGNVYLTILTFLLGGTITGFYSLNSKTTCTGWEWFLFYLIIAVLVLGIILTLTALKPYLKNGTGNLDGSAFYFADVASFTKNEYKQIMETRTIIDFHGDMVNQTHQLASGLTKKYRLLSWSTFLIGIAIILILIFGLIIFK